MTVTELRKKLEVIERQRHGDCTVVLSDDLDEITLEPTETRIMHRVINYTGRYAIEDDLFETPEDVEKDMGERIDTEPVIVLH